MSIEKVADYPNSHPHGFYAVGGSLHTDCQSYVERRADRELYDALRRHEFCYILTSRQMGKSSLMIRTVHRLRREGSYAAVLDLTAVGSNLTAEQWYLGLLDRLAEQLHLEDELDEYWDAHRESGPLHRWMSALREVVLARLSAPLVIFIDEIDVVRSLPFSSDEFFAAIRECYNRRADDETFQTLTFCLLGVAAPSDLIRDARLTPFNVGHRIELADFTPSEAAPLARGLEYRKQIAAGGQNRDAKAHENNNYADTGTASPYSQQLLARILYWTDGHPYLTQRLCAAVADALSAPTPNAEHKPSVSVSDSDRKMQPNYSRQPSFRTPSTQYPTPALVDQVCSDLLLTVRARERDDNLLFVRERLLRSDVDMVTLLDTYGRVLAGKRVADAESNAVATALRLSGVVKSKGCWLRVRNRIYATVFNRIWVRENLPYAELWRQRRAFRRGMVRTGLVSAAILAIMAVLIWKTVSASRHVQGLLAQSEEDHGLQLLQDGTSLGLVYLTEAKRMDPDGSRPSQWAGWYESCVGRMSQTLPLDCGLQNNMAPEGGGLAFSGDGKLLASWCPAPGADGKADRDSGSRLQIWDVVTGRMRGSTISISGSVDLALFSPDGRQVITRLSRWTTKPSGLQTWNTETGQPIGSPLPTTGYVSTMQFSPDSHLLLTSDEKALKLWDTVTGRLERTPWQSDPRSMVADQSGMLGTPRGEVALSPDGRSVAYQIGNSLYRCNIDGTHLVELVANSFEEAQLLAFTRDGKRLTCVWYSWLYQGDSNGRRLLMQQWEAGSGRAVTPLRHMDPIRELNGRDGDWYVTVSRNRTVQKWDSATGKPVGVSIQLPDDYHETTQLIAVSSDGTRLAATSRDNKTLVWEMATGQPIGLPVQYLNQMEAVHLSPDGSRMSLYDGILKVVRVWQLAGHTAFRLPLKLDTRQVTAFSPDGGRLAVYRYDNGVQLWNTRTGEKLGLPLPIIHESNGKYHVGGINSEILRRPLQFSTDGRLLAVVTGDLTVQLINADSGLPVGSPMVNNGYVEAFALRPDGKQLAVGVARPTDSTSTFVEYKSGAVQLWDTTAGQSVGAPFKSGFIVFGVVYSADGKRLMATSSNSERKEWNLDTLKTTAGEDTQASIYTHAPFAEYQPGGNILATYSEGNISTPSVQIWEGSGWQRLQRSLKIQNILIPSQQPIIGFSPDGKWLAAAQHGTRDHNGVILWGTSDWEPKEVSLPDAYSIIDARYSPDGKWLAVAAEDPTEMRSGTGADKWMVELVNLDSGRVNNQILQQNGSFMAMAFLPDGNLEVAASTRDFVRLWKLPTRSVGDDEIELRTWLALGVRLDENKHIQDIPPAEWRKLQVKLK